LALPKRSRGDHGTCGARSELQNHGNRAIVYQFDIHVRPEHAGLHHGTQCSERVGERVDQRLGDHTGSGRIPGRAAAFCGVGVERELADHQDRRVDIGRGLFVGVELVKDRATKTPFAPKLAMDAVIKREAMARGLMVYPMGGTVDGVSGSHVLLAPPFICTADDIDRIIGRLTDAIDSALCVTGAVVGGTQQLVAS